MKELQDKQSRLDYLWENYGDGKLDEQLDELKEEVGEQLTTISDKVEKIEEKLNPTTPEELQAIEDQYSYGIRWKKNSLDPVVERVGHPIQEKFDDLTYETTQIFEVHDNIKAYADGIELNNYNWALQAEECNASVEYTIQGKSYVIYDNIKRVENGKTYYDLPDWLSVGTEVGVYRGGYYGGPIQDWINNKDIKLTIGEQVNINNIYYYPIVFSETYSGKQYYNDYVQQYYGYAMFKISPTIDLTDHDVDVRLQAYYKFKETDDYYEVRVSNKNLQYIDPSWKYFNIGCSAYYKSLDDDYNMKSKTNSIPTNNNDGSYDVGNSDYYNLMMCWLPAIEYGSFNFPKTTVTNTEKTGQGNHLGTRNGTFRTTDGNTGYKYRGIENPTSFGCICYMSNSVVKSDTSYVYICQSDSESQTLIINKDKNVKSNIQQIYLDTTFPKVLNQEQNTGYVATFTPIDNEFEDGMFVCRGDNNSPFSWSFTAPEFVGCRSI